LPYGKADGNNYYSPAKANFSGKKDIQMLSLRGGGDLSRYNGDGGISLQALGPHSGSSGPTAIVMQHTTSTFSGQSLTTKLGLFQGLIHPMKMGRL
jgi:hypothetical protein